MMIDCSGKKLDLNSPKIMAILNLTPDSFSDGGQFYAADKSIAKALQQAEKMLEQGADIIDVGGESTRPGASEVSVCEEIERVVPVIQALSHLPIPVSIDTSKPEVMQQAVAAGASIINDVCGLASIQARECAAQLNVPVCIMHMQGAPRTMQASPQYKDVVKEISEFLLLRATEIEAAGVKREHIIVDPGFGFGKTLEHNLQLLKSLRSLANLGYPLLIGVSRKAFLGKITGKEVEQRAAASVSTALLAVQQGANILRVHDVAETRDMLKLMNAVEQVQEN